MHHAPPKVYLMMIEKPCGNNFSDYLLSGLRYLGNVGTDLLYLGKKLEEQCKVGTILANFLLGSFSPFHSFKKWKVCSAGEHLQGLPPRMQLWKLSGGQGIPVIVLRLHVFSVHWASFALSAQCQPHYSCLVTAAGSKPWVSNGFKKTLRSKWEERTIIFLWDR